MRTLAAALAATLALYPLAAPAQSPQPPGAPSRPALTLEAALRRASEANLDLQAARARLEQAQAGIARAWSQHLLQVHAGASYTRNSYSSAIDLPTGFYVRDLGSPQGPPAGQGVPGEPTALAVVPSGVSHAVLLEQDQLGARVEVSQPLVAPPLWFSIRASRQGAAAAEQSVDAARREVLFGVARAYYGVVSLAKLVDVSERLLEIARRQERDAASRYRAGTIPRVGPVRAEIDRARAEQDVVRARNAYQSARIALALLLDREPDFEVQEAPEPRLPGDLGGLNETAQRQRPDLRAARLGEEAARSLRLSSVMRYLPTVGAFGWWQVSNATGFSGQRDSWAVGIGLSWTLLDGGLREAEVREGSARAAEATARRSLAEATAAAEVRQAVLDLESARANARKAREEADLAAENQRLVETSYQAGAATAVEQADAAASLRNAEVRATTEALQAQVAALRVLYVAGLFDPAG